MDKKDLPESDICDKLIRPAIEAASLGGLLQIYRVYRRLCAYLRQRLATAQGTQSHLADTLVEQALA
ncbi:MAG: hypothetical protein U1F50_12600 [Rubrivivax sp.]